MRADEYSFRTPTQLEKILRSSMTDGLSHAEVAKRIRRGEKFDPEKKGAFLAFFGKALKSGVLFMLPIIFFAAYFLHASILFLTVFYVAYAFLMMVLFVIRRRRIRNMETMLSPRVDVIRAGERCSVAPESLVVGDLLLLSAGQVLYTNAILLSDTPLKIFGIRDDRRMTLEKVGGPCFAYDGEPDNALRPMDIIREGEGIAFVTKAEEEKDSLLRRGGAVYENHAMLCKISSRLSLIMSFLILFVSLFRVCFTKDYVLLGEALCVCGVLSTVALTDFYPLLFDLLFVYRNRKLYAEERGMVTSLSDAQTLVGIDAYVLPTRSMLRSARYSVRAFEDVSGRRYKENGGETPYELSLLSALLTATAQKCSLGMDEEAVLGFCSHRCFDNRNVCLLSRSSNGRFTLSSFRSDSDGRSFSVVSAEAEYVIPQLLYASEDGKTRLLDDRTKRQMLSGVMRLKENGYRLLAYAETQTRNTAAAFPTSFSDLKLLGFFLLRKGTDTQAFATLKMLEREGKKAFFIHDGEDASWLTKEIKPLEDVPVLDGTRTSFREELAVFVQSEEMPFAIGVHLSSLQRAQVVDALENSGRRVAAAGRDLDDHRMMCSASVGIAPLQEDAQNAPPLLLETAAVRVREHITSQVNCVRRAPDMLGSFGVLTAALCSSVIVRGTLALLGFLFGVAFLPFQFYALFGCFSDLLLFISFIRAAGEKKYDTPESMLLEKQKCLALFFASFFGALSVGGIGVAVSSYSSAFAFRPDAFTLLSFLLILNVGMWCFSTARHTPTLLLFPVLSAVGAGALFLTGYITQGRWGLLATPELFFWSLLPVAALLTVGKAFESYFTHKNKKIDKEFSHE